MNPTFSMTIPGSGDRPMAADLFIPDGTGVVPLLVYAHGFNGFKDWGGANLIAAEALNAGFAWLRFNFSHNGTTPENPQEFVDQNAFAANTYTIELADLKAVFDAVTEPGTGFSERIDMDRIGLIGHSKGGAEAIVYAAEDSGVKALVTWAAVSAARTPWDSWDDARVQAWRESGREHIPNSRTGQQMPLDYTLVEDYEQNRERFNVVQAASRVRVPWLICHGSADTSVNVSHAQRLHAANPSSELFVLDTDHVFGRKHPWTEPALPEPMLDVLDRSFEFFHKSLS